METVVVAPLLQRGRRPDAARYVGEGKQERRERGLQHELERACVDDIDRVERADLAGANAAAGGRLRIADAVDVELYRGRVERGAVLELDAGPEPKHEG